MRISVDKLFGTDVEAIVVDQRVRLMGELALRYPAGVQVNATISRISHGVYMEGVIDEPERETCVRCLEPFWRHTRVVIEEPFSEDVAPQDALFSDVEPLLDRTIDLQDLVTQLLEVDEPLAAVCKEDCLGICPMCGANRNVNKCGCRDAWAEHPLAGLAHLLDERASD